MCSPGAMPISRCDNVYVPSVTINCAVTILSHKPSPHPAFHYFQYNRKLAGPWECAWVDVCTVSTLQYLNQAPLPNPKSRSQSPRPTPLIHSSVPPVCQCHCARLTPVMLTPVLPTPMPHVGPTSVEVASPGSLSAMTRSPTTVVSQSETVVNQIFHINRSCSSCLSLTVNSRE